MECIVDLSNLNGPKWIPGQIFDHMQTLSMFFAVHGAYCGNDKRKRWIWHEKGRADLCWPATLSMAGRWQALRPGKVNKDTLEQTTIKNVIKLARRLNALNIGCLGDIASKTRNIQEKILHQISRAVQAVSQVKKTDSPTLGSKILHHYFPSAIPVWDNEYIKKAIERLRLKESSNYTSYLRFCVDQVSLLSLSKLQQIRERFGEAYADYAPGILHSEESSLLWRLDAKIVEYCLVNADAADI